MQKARKPPLGTQMFTPDGLMNHNWMKWFDEIGRGWNDYRQSPDKLFKSNGTLYTADYGKVIVFDNGSSSVTCTLPIINDTDIYCWIGPIYRLGTGRVTITAGSNDKVEYSSEGGSIYCDEERRAAANVTLEVIGSHQWGIIGGTGLWKTD
jgi:hypothetical protein